MKTWSDMQGLKKTGKVWELLRDTVHQNKEVKQCRQDPGNTGSTTEEKKRRVPG